MSYDELELDKLGDEKTALFFLISDTDSTYNFIVALAFSQMIRFLILSIRHILRTLRYLQEEMHLNFVNS